MGCAACRDLPALSTRPGELLLSPALGHTFARLKRHVDSAAVEGEARQHESGVLGVDVGEGRLPAVLRQIGGELTPVESASCPSLFLESGKCFDLSMLARMQPLATLLARAESGWLVDLLADERLTAHFQPIVHARDPGRAFAHEALLRGVSATGELVAPNQLFGAARAANMLFQLDRSARITAIREASRHGLTTPIFINFNPTSIYDASFCLRTTFEAARDVGMPASNFVFEVVESDRVSDPDHLLGILHEYRHNGFRVALDDLGAAYGSLNMLQSLQPDFVKIDRQLVSTIHEDRTRQAILRHLASMARELGIAIIAEGVEEAGEAEWLSEVGVDYLQGFYFARPASPPPALAAS